MASTVSSHFRFPKLAPAIIFIFSNLQAEVLTWKEIAFRVLQNSPDLRVQSYTPKITSQEIAKANTEFEPNLSSELQFSKTKSEGDLTVSNPLPSNSPFDSEDSNHSLSLGIQKKLEQGTELELKGSIIRSDSQIDAPTTSFDGKDDSDNIALSLRQPILEGRGKDIQTTRIRQANLALDISKHQLAAYSETLIYHALINSLKLYLHQQHLNVVNKALELEKKELKEVLLKIEAGVLARTENISAQASLATREQSKILIANAIEQSRLDLVHALSPNPGDLWNYQINFPEFKIPEWAQVHSLDHHLNSALQNRHDLKEVITQHKSRQLEVIYAKNGQLPRLDFFATLGYSDFDKRDAFNAIDTKGDGLQYQMGLQFQLPLSRKGDQARLQQTQYQTQQAEAAIQNLKRTLEKDLRKVYSDFQTFENQFKQVKLNKELRKQNLETELDKRTQGLSTSLQVERARNDYLDSQFKEIEVQVNELLTRFTIFYRDGSLLARLGLTL